MVISTPGKAVMASTWPSRESWTTPPLLSTTRRAVVAWLRAASSTVRNSSVGSEATGTEGLGVGVAGSPPSQAASDSSGSSAPTTRPRSRAASGMTKPSMSPPPFGAATPRRSVGSLPA